jgi:sugar lactone lactonase YvrE
VDLSLKPHFVIDALRFDDTGRLWVLTMRGGVQRAVFDIFSPAGEFLGSVTVPAHVTTYALGGTWLATGGEDADGIPRITLWRVRN